MRIDLRTGKATTPVGLRVADFGGLPARVVARTTVQNIYETIGDNPSTTWDPQSFAAASDADHLLVQTNDIVTEFSFRDRRKNPNRNWFLPNRNPLALLRYGPKNTIEAWAAEKTVKGVVFSRYEGARGPHGGSLRRTLTLAAPLPREFGSHLGGVGGFDPESRIFLASVFVGGRNRTERFDLSGRVVPARPSEGSLDDASSSVLLAWSLWGHNPAVLGGTAAWEPLAYSGNRKYWLLRRKADGKAFLLRR